MGGGGSNVGTYEGGGEERGSSGFATERMRRCEDASAAFSCSAADIPDEAVTVLGAVAWLCGTFALRGPLGAFEPDRARVCNGGVGC